MEGLALNSVIEDCKNFLQGIMGLDMLPGWHWMWVDLTQEEIRWALVKSSISDNSSKGSKDVKEEDNVELASKGKIKIYS